MKMMINANSNIEAVKTKTSEKLFYKFLAEKAEGMGIAKIAPFNGQYFDLLYIEDRKAALFKFVDTNEDTFSILAEEIVEVIEEEHTAANSMLRRRLDGETVSYYFVMPYIELAEHGIDCDIIIDCKRFGELTDGKRSLGSLLSEVKTSKETLLQKLAGEYFVFRKEHSFGEVIVDMSTENKKLQAALMDRAQMEAVNSLHYGTTFLEGSTGTGKTTVMFSKMIKLARIYSKDKFLYITFSKQLANSIRILLKQQHPDIENIRVINFHQFILLLGKKYNLKLNKQSKQNFAKEFQKVFQKVEKIYSGKRSFKGIFVDESENLSLDEIRFLRDISYQTKNILYLSYDEAKRMTPLDENGRSVEEIAWDDHLELSDNYRASQEVARFNRDFQNDINAFSALELERVGNYFRTFSAIRSQKGSANVIEYEAPEEMMEKMLEIIRAYEKEGVALSDIGVIYPYNERTTGSPVHAKRDLKNFLEGHGLIVDLAEEESRDFNTAKGLTLSNIYNCTNLEFKVVILCYLDMLYTDPTKLRSKEVQKMLNIIYTASGRAKDDLLVMIKKGEDRPGVMDLLSQKILF